MLARALARPEIVDGIIQGAALAHRHGGRRRTTDGRDLRQ